MSELNKESVEQAGGDERAAFEAAFAAMGRPVCRADYDQDAYGTPFDDGGWTGWQARAALAQPSPAQAEQAEVKRLREAYEWGYDDGQNNPNGYSDKKERDACVNKLLKQPSLAQAEAARLREENANLILTCASLDSEKREMQHKWDAIIAERDAALTRVAELEQKSAGSWTVDTSCGRPILMYEGCSVIEDQTAYEVIRMIKWIGELERQKPVATVAKVPGEDWNSLDFHRDLQDMQPGTKLYAAPVAQAQQLNDLDKQCRDDVARALGLRPNQERGFAWSYLLASIKSCVKASGDSAQAQHSVPAYVSYTTQPAESLAGIALRQLKDESRWVEIRDINAHAFPDMRSHSYYPAGTVIKLPAAAPGKEGV
ncbi:TPA: LysM peptidoglycan-binding domain-containing protein [Pseudomonas aeruginosa]